MKPVWQEYVREVPLTICYPIGESWVSGTPREYGFQPKRHYMYYHKGKLSWYYDLNELNAAGEMILGKLKWDKARIEPFFARLKAIGDELDDTCVKLHSIPSRYKSEPLADTFDQFYKIWRRFWDASIGLDSVHNSEFMTQLFLNELAPLAGDMQEAMNWFRTLSAISWQSPVAKSEKAHWELLAEAQRQGKAAGNSFTKKLQAYLDKYFWISSGWFPRQIENEQSVRKKIEHDLKAGIDLAAKIKAMEKNKKKQLQEKTRLMQKIQPTPRLEFLLAFHEKHARFQEYKKQLSVTSCFYTQTLFSLIGERTGLVGERVYWLLPGEVRPALEGTLPAQINARESECLFVIEPNVQFEKDGIEATQTRKAFLAEEMKSEDTRQIFGVGASAGKAKGMVRVVIEAKNAHLVQKGEILVTGMTTPDFVLAMKRAAAVVTDEGGITCHAAIVSRELNKPCVIGTRRATKILKDGEEVEVDGFKGMVRKVKK